MSWCLYCWFLVFVVVLLELLLLIVLCGENNKCGRSSGAIVGFDEAMVPVVAVVGFVVLLYGRHFNTATHNTIMQVCSLQALGFYLCLFLIFVVIKMVEGDGFVCSCDAGMFIFYLFIFFLFFLLFDGCHKLSEIKRSLQ